MGKLIKLHGGFSIKPCLITGGSRAVDLLRCVDPTGQDIGSQQLEFPKMGRVPQIIHFDRNCHYKPSLVFGDPFSDKPILC